MRGNRPSCLNVCDMSKSNKLRDSFCATVVGRKRSMSSCEALQLPYVFR